LFRVKLVMLTVRTPRSGAGFRAVHSEPCWVHIRNRGNNQGQ
jgi:hypothetical protein